MFKELYEAWKKEAENTELQPLPRDFYAKLIDYVNKIRKEDRMLDRKTVKAQLVKHEARNVKNLIEKLTKLRYRKILRLTSTGKTIPIDRLTMEEEKAYTELSHSLEALRNLLKNVSRGKTSSLEAKSSAEKVVARFLQETPSIIGTDLKAYGPFKPEDVAILPSENANALAKQGIVKILDVK